MLWSVLIFLLLCAIGGLLWLYRRQDQNWRQEMAALENGETAPKTVLPAFLDTLSRFKLGKAKNVRTQSLAKTRLLAYREYEPQQEPAALEYIDDTCRFTESPQTVPSENKAHVVPHTVIGRNGKVRRSNVPDPEIVPFVEDELPEYVPRVVRGKALDEITLEEAKRSLVEAVCQEQAEKNTAALRQSVEPSAETGEESVFARPKVHKQPVDGLEIIDFNDPLLRRMCERPRANVEKAQKARKPHIELNQTALKTAEREAVIPVSDMPSRWDAIDEEHIHHNLARRSAARHRLAAAVAPVQSFDQTVIQRDEILQNLLNTAVSGNRISRSNRFTETECETVPSENVRDEQAASVQRKPLFPPKTQTIHPNKPAFVAKTPEPAATVVEPPVVPVVEQMPIDIPEPPVFSSAPELVAPKPEISAHVSDNPRRMIQDFLISESADEIEIVPSRSAFAAETLADENEDGLSAFEQPKRFAPQVETVRVQAMPSENRVFAPAEQTVQPVQTMQTLIPSEIQTACDDVDFEDEEAFESESSSDIYPHPTASLLLPPQFDPSATQTEEALLENSITIEEKLAEFKVKVKVVDSYSGPVITRYEIEPDVGVRGNAVLNLEKDLARSLGVASIRVVETIPGKTCMGLELPNPRRQVIRLSEIFNATAFAESKSKLTLALGQDITGKPVVTDLAKAPHLLVAGTTGSGKSVGVNAMILSMLFKAAPEEVRMIMIDPKMLELSIYEGIPHLLAPVVTDMKLAANALNWCVNEMEKRYRLMSYAGVRNLAGYNEKIAAAAKQGEKMANPFTLTPDNPEYLEKLPYIVVVVDEFADLMMTAGKKIEELIARLAQKARAAGIHLILATQRPSVDVITGLIKANIPTRIAFQVSSKVDSRTILDQMGAENLLGQGDMLFLPPGTGYPQRVHGAFASDDEVHRVVEYLKQFGEPDYIDEVLGGGASDDFGSIGRNHESDMDPMYDEAVAFILKSRKASISGVQRALRIGYNRAARLIDQMEADGIISAPEANGNRTILAQNSSHLD